MKNQVALSSHVAGIDFGTSNSSVGHWRDGLASLVDFNGDGSSVPSAIFYSTESDDVSFGKQAVANYTLGTEGRLLRALKSVLGSSLINEKTLIRNQRMAFADIIGDFFGYLRRTLEQVDDGLVDSVVVGRPVHFVDADAGRDAEAERQLHDIAAAAGFSNIEFQYEPIAAALDYERQLNQEQLVLIVDIGGGTADFSVIRLSPDRRDDADRSADILATAGVHIGGTDLDQLLSLHNVMPHLGLGSLVKNTERELPRSVFHDLATWHKIPLLYNNVNENRIRQMVLDTDQPHKLAKLLSIVEERAGHSLARAVEQVKIELSSRQNAQLEMKLEGTELLSEPVSRDEFELAICTAIESLQQCVEKGLADAQVKRSSVCSVFYTGGSSSVPCLRAAFETLLPTASHVSGDVFGSVATGLTIDAARRFA